MGGVQLSIFEQPTQALSPILDPLAANEPSITSEFGLGDIISKFDEVTIENNSLITDEDKAFCDETQKNFDSAVSLILKAKRFYQNNEMSNNFLSTGNLIKDLDLKLDEKLDLFISKIAGYFRKNYSITINTSEFRKYDHSVTYKDIVDDIILQMDGKNFSEKASEEIKEALRGTIYNISKVKVQSVKVSIADYLYFEGWFNGQFRNNRSENLSKLLHAIEHFDSGAKVMRSTLVQLSNSYARNDWFEVFSFTSMNKFESLRCFKNGKVELKFVTHDDAMAFAKDYLKYI